MLPFTDIHPATIVDLRALHAYTRAADQGVVFDSEIAYTRDGSATGTFLSSMLLSRSMVVLVGYSRRHTERATIIGQLRLRLVDHLAQVVHMACSLEEDTGDSGWLQMLDAMTSEAGRRGAHMLTAEVDEHSPLFVTMRTAGFAVYARQEIWCLPQDKPLPTLVLPGTLADERDEDTMDIQLLYSNIVPRLVQPIAVPSRESRGIVYRSGGRIQGYIAVSEGKGGLYLMPFLHPDVLGDEAAALMAGVIRFALEGRRRAGRNPVYVCVRRYQDWLAESLAELGFHSSTQQAVMVRHIAAGVRQAQFARLQPTLALTVSPPASGMSRVEPHTDETVR